MNETLNTATACIIHQDFWDSTNFKNKAKWKPKFKLQNGLQKTYDYIKENQGKLK